MLNPSMQELMKRVGNRYLLVNLAAQRARDIADEAEQSGVPLTDKAVKTTRSARRTPTRRMRTAKRRFPAAAWTSSMTRSSTTAIFRRRTAKRCALQERPSFCA